MTHGQARQAGYTERVAVAEVFIPDDAARAAILSGAPLSELRHAMRAAGYKTMRESALDLVGLGVTSLDEVNRVLTDEQATLGRPEQVQQPAAAGRKHRILVTDDDRMIRRLVKMLARIRGVFRRAERAA